MRSMNQWCAWALVVCSIACGGDDSISDTRTVTSLSPSERTSACKHLQTKFTRIGDSYAQISCTVTAFTIANGDSATCVQQRTQCIISAKTMPDQMFDLDCDTDDASELAQCGDLTVGEMNACADAIANMAGGAAKQVDCSSTRQTIASATSGLQMPGECQPLADHCPDLVSMTGLR